jgi:glycosyltransferase involved in cell wall biosynthesis
MHRADMLVVPSVPTDSGRREGIPVVLMEAMATELPVIASGISGIPELVENERSGLLVPPADPQGIADAVQRLMDDRDLRRRIARAGRMTVMAEFDQATNARRLIERLGLA